MENPTIDPGTFVTCYNAFPSSEQVPRGGVMPGKYCTVYLRLLVGTFLLVVNTRIIGEAVSHG